MQVTESFPRSPKVGVPCCAGHNLVHEDHDMMRAYVVVGGAGQDNAPVLNPTTTLIVNEAAGGLEFSLDTLSA
jgi:hypothetical protein